jgi:hypothetical protein
VNASRIVPASQRIQVIAVRTPLYRPSHDGHEWRGIAASTVPRRWACGDAGVQVPSSRAQLGEHGAMVVKRASAVALA